MKKRHITTTLALMLLTAAVTYGITFFGMQKVTDTQVKKFNTVVAENERIYEVRNNIETLFVNEYDEARMIDGALAGMVAYLGDPWSYYLNEEEFTEYTRSLMGNMIGIGVTVTQDEPTGGIRVIDVYENSPAKKAGIMSGDIIVSVNNERVSDIGYEVAVDNVKGTEGTSVSLQIYRASQENTFTVSAVREQFQVENVKSQMVDGIGYITIRSFDIGVGHQFVTAVHNLQNQGAKGFVFDLRNNPGGAMTELVTALDILLPEGTIITARDKSGYVEEYKSDANEMKLPMTVLINSSSYSAAEFFAASLQEHNKATIIGTPTTGKGCAQTPIKLEHGGGLVLSTSKYFTASGKSLADTNGIKPDIEVKLTDEQAKNFYTLALTDDPQFMAALNKIKEQIAPQEPAEETQG